MALPLLALPALAQTGAGLFQSIFSGRKKQERELEKQLGQSPMYQANKGISDYYQQALNRFNENPYQSAQYQTAARNAQRLTSTGLSALQDRRSALAGVNRLVGVQNDALQNAAVQAEQQRNIRFNQLGSATQAQAGEQRRAFDINTMSPYLRRLQMQQMKTGAANARFDAGLSNIFGGLGSASTILGNMPNQSTDGTQNAAGSVSQQQLGMMNLGGNRPQSFNRYNWNRPNQFTYNSFGMLNTKP
jgi:hypothetical protein